MPGGCVIGNRPIDLHVRALQGLGADVHLSGGIVKVMEKYFLETQFYRRKTRKHRNRNS